MLESNRANGVTQGAVGALSLPDDRIITASFRGLNRALCHFGLNEIPVLHPSSVAQLKIPNLFAWKANDPDFKFLKACELILVNTLQDLNRPLDPAKLLAFLPDAFSTFGALTREVLSLLSPTPERGPNLPEFRSTSQRPSPLQVLNAIRKAIVSVNGGQPLTEKVRYGAAWNGTLALNCVTLHNSTIRSEFLVKSIQIEAIRLLRPSLIPPDNSMVLLPEIREPTLLGVFNSIFPWICNGRESSPIQGTETARDLQIWNQTPSIDRGSFLLPTSDLLILRQTPKYRLEATEKTSPTDMTDGLNRNSQLYRLIEVSLDPSSVFRACRSLKMSVAGFDVELPINRKSTVQTMLSELNLTLDISIKEDIIHLSRFSSRSEFEEDDIDIIAILGPAISELYGSSLVLDFRGTHMMIHPSMISDDVISAHCVKRALLKSL